MTQKRAREEYGEGEQADVKLEVKSSRHEQGDMHGGAEAAAGPDGTSEPKEDVQHEGGSSHAGMEGSGRQEEEEDDRIFLPTSSSRASVKKGHECPYLDTISRQVRVAQGGRSVRQGCKRAHLQALGMFMDLC